MPRIHQLTFAEFDKQFPDETARRTYLQHNLYPHGVVRHSRGEYVAGAVHTNTSEGFWSIIKRGIVGMFHEVRSKHLPLDVNEFEFRYNKRKTADIFGAAIRLC